MSLRFTTLSVKMQQEEAQKKEAKFLGLKSKKIITL